MKLMTLLFCCLLSSNAFSTCNPSIVREKPDAVYSDNNDGTVHR